MSRNQRLALVLAAVAVAVVAFVVASPGGDDEDTPETTAQTVTDSVETIRTTPDEVVPPAPPVERIRINGGEVVGGARRITVKKGDRVRIVVSADADDDIHLHGYDIELEAGPGSPARFDFRASIEGEFEIESHVAEDAGREPLVATLVVEPS
ncbi:MAG TPA: hypothetical protein VFQ12_12130 [Thermoleophilaceae bacterium]|nr:hypothetical protein [Thermoleophilaceae bacterium]